MIYADYNFYKEQFCGRSVPQDDFRYFAARASEYINEQTFDRITDEYMKNEEAAVLKIKNCCCALAESEYNFNQRSDISSEKNGSYPPEYVDDDEKEEQPKRPPVFDWKYDAAFILGDFRRYYGIDLLSVEYMHWWEFRCLFNALPDDSQCQKRIDIRSADLSQIKDDARRQQIARIQRQIALPFEMDEDDMAVIFEG